jgi:pimeloyl-ACP methyl ester carboxylesterase
MSTFVLVHGAWHGAWCWYKIVPLLQNAGHKVIALDLPAMGKDRSPITAATLDRYVDVVADALGRQSGKSILVGHSMGGLTISQSAEQHPDRVEALVYVSALLLRAGESVLSMATQFPGELGKNATASADKRAMIFDAAAAREVLYNECSDEDVALATLLLQPQPLAPMATPQWVTAARFGRVPRIYIQCLRDNTMPPPLQRAMYEATPCARVISMDTDHSPFFSRPRELARHLLDIGNSAAGSA